MKKPKTLGAIELAISVTSLSTTSCEPVALIEAARPVELTAAGQ